MMAAAAGPKVARTVYAHALGKTEVPSPANRLVRRERRLGRFPDSVAAVLHDVGRTLQPYYSGDDAALAEQIASICPVDMLIDVSGTEATKAFVDMHEHVRNPLHTPLFYPSYNDNGKQAAIADIQHPIARI